MGFLERETGRKPRDINNTNLNECHKVDILACYYRAQFHSLPIDFL